MNRRGFLSFIGAAVAGAALPVEFAAAKVARAPDWWKGRVVRYTCAPLAPGRYTFSANMRDDEMYYGLFIGGVTAAGGETVFEVPIKDGGVFSNPHLSQQAVQWNIYGPGTYHWWEGDRGPATSELVAL